MKILLASSVLLFSIVAWTASAQEDLVAQSGEHETFSRLVFPLAEEITWDIDQSDRLVSISFPNLEATLNTQGLMSRLPTGRLENIRAQPGTVELELGCDCVVDVFRFDGRFVVIDVVDRPAAVEQVEEVQKKQPIISFENYQPNHVAALAERTLPLVRPDVNPDAPVQSARIFSDDVLASQMADAVAAQLLAPSGDLAPTNGNGIGLGPTQIEINTPFRNQPPQLAIAQQETCMLPAYADISQWPSHQEVLQSIGRMRREVFDDSGQVTADNARSLAASYIALGFGAEARAILEMGGENSSLIDALAQVVDGLPSPSNSRLREAYACPNALAFWAVLSAGALPSGAELNENAVEVTLAKMRPEYRKAYAGTVIARLRSGGYEEAARQIEGLMARTGSSSDREVDVFDPVALAKLELEDRLAKLRTQAFANTPTSAEALNALLEEHMQSRIALDDALLTYAGSFVETVEDGELRVGIHAGLLFGLVLSGYPFEALQAYERLLLVQPEHTITHLDALVSLATEVVPADEFALFVVGLGELITSETVATETILDVAKRMVDVGMPSKGLQLMTRRDLDQSSEKRLISARAFLAMGNPGEALERIANLVTSEAREIRAYAYLRMGEYDEAFPYLAETDPLHAPTGWIAQRLDAREVQPYSRQVLLEQVSAQPSGESEPTMRALLEETSQMRSTIEGVLREQ